MGIPKRKNNIEVYPGKELLPRRQELLDFITKSDPYLPDSILHDDLDRGMLDYVEKNFIVVSDGKKIPMIPRILTIQRWGELQNTWEYSDDEGNIQLPFISVIRKPDVQPGTNPSVQRTIPDRHRFHYSTVKKQDSNGMLGADVYRIPQPIPVDISYDVSIVCHKFRDLNRFNKMVMQNFSSRQDYTTIKGHYVPLVLERIEDNTPMDTIDGRRFYVQNYQFILLGFLIDSDEFDVKPAINRSILLTEFVDTKKTTKKIVPKNIDIIIATLFGNGIQTVFGVGEPIDILFNVAINGMIQELNVDYYHIAGTSKVTFVTPPPPGSVVTVTYYKGTSNAILVNNQGFVLQVTTENFIYDGSSLIFTTSNPINDVVTFTINGLVESDDVGYTVTGTNTVELNYTPVVGSRIGITYTY
jgi:hypothetical protein